MGNSLDFKFRGYDSRTGRFLSVDPLTSKFPMLTPYQFASNTPIQAIDLDGLEGISATTGQIQAMNYTGNAIRNAVVSWWNSPLSGGEKINAEMLNIKYGIKPETKGELLIGMVGNGTNKMGELSMVTGGPNANKYYSGKTQVRVVNTPQKSGSEARQLLNRALERQKLTKAPNEFKEKWSDKDGYDYEVRVHGPSDKAPEGSNASSNTVLRVARRERSTDESGQGSGWEYADDKGNWYKQRDMKSGDAPANAANDTHIPLKN